MAHIRGFPPISRADARVLILGSMPSRESLARQQYYAHPRNALWPILSALLEIEDSSYSARTEQVVRRGVAIWDVLKACFRSGSLDSAIDERTLVTNDFRSFFDHHRRIRAVFFNGAKAESVYRRHVLPGLAGAAAALPLQRLPSTSPAHAGMSLEQKMAAWRVLLDYVVEWNAATGSARREQAMIRIRKVDHLVLRSNDVAGMVRFYCDVLGCRVERELPPATGLIQLRAGDALIDLVAVDSELGRAGGGPPTATENNLDHFCLELEVVDPDELRAWLDSHGIDSGDFQVRYGAGGFGPSIYLRDPDGNTVELRISSASTA